MIKLVNQENKETKNPIYRKYEHRCRLISLTTSFTFCERSLSNCCNTSCKVKKDTSNNSIVKSSYQEPQSMSFHLLVETIMVKQSTCSTEIIKTLVG